MPKRKNSAKKELKKIEHEIEDVKKTVVKEHETEESELKEFEKEIQELKKELHTSVVEKFTFRDIARGIVGSILGMSVMAWHPQVQERALEMHWFNIFVIILVTILAGTSVLYFSQYRKIKEQRIIFNLLPKRFVIFYLLSMAVVFSVYTLFGVIKIGMPFESVLKLVLVLTLPAMIGASTADIIR